MEIDGRDFLNTPPTKTVRFGGSVVATLAKYKQVTLDQRSYYIHVFIVYSCPLKLDILSCKPFSMCLL
jgi:hypothetical protein